MTIRVSKKNKQKYVLLVSPAPIDSYPPVLYQMRLLDSRGYGVIVISSNIQVLKSELQSDDIILKFSNLSQGGKIKRLFGKLLFCYQLVCLRHRYRSRLISEIAYDPEGVFFSQMCPFKSTYRIAHLHEVLFDPLNRFYEKYAVRNLSKFDLIVVADEQRARLLKGQAKLSAIPLAVPNYPLQMNPTGDFDGGVSRDETSFRVVYHGSLGLSQALDTVIRSMPMWPDNAILHLFGDDSKIDSKILKDLVSEYSLDNRVVFKGWRPLAQIEAILPSYDLGLSLLRPLNDNWLYAAGASNKRYQYMQAGIPQISDNNPGVEELIEGNNVGFCVDPDDPRELAEKVKFYCDNREECRAAGIRARKIQIENFRYDIGFSPVIRILDSRSR